MHTKLICGLHNLKQHPGCVVTIGNFDGVHQGHQAILAKLVKTGQSLRIPSVVVTFEPQPLEFFLPKKPVARLTRLREKFYYLAECQVDEVLVLRFNQWLANLRAEEFVRRILCEGLHARHVIVGDDFQFGFQREGDFAFLEKCGKALGFEVEHMPTISQDDARISSTRIRQALAKAEHAEVAKLLGRPYAMMGRVVHGDKLGRELGFPTANIYLHRAMTPVSGVYIVKLSLNGKIYPGVANVGIRPTVGGTRTLLEVHLFDFNQDIYGQHVSVEFCEKLRDEEYYPNLELLAQQIRRDADQARAYFKTEIKENDRL